MTKLTPPSPQNKRKRTQFFLANPEHHGAKEWMRQINVEIITQAHREFVAQKPVLSMVDGKIKQEVKFTLEQLAEKTWARFYKNGDTKEKEHGKE